MSSKDFAYYVKDLPDEDQKALKLSSPAHWLDFTIAFILCLGQLGLLGDSGDPVEDRPPAHESDPNDPNDYKKGATADALRKSWARRQQQKFAILVQLTRGCPEAALIFQDFEVSDFNGVYTALIKEFEATNENRHTAMQKATQLAVGVTERIDQQLSLFKKIKFPREATPLLLKIGQLTAQLARLDTQLARPDRLRRAMLNYIERFIEFDMRVGQRVRLYMNPL